RSGPTPAATSPAAWAGPPAASWASPCPTGSRAPRSAARRDRRAARRTPRSRRTRDFRVRILLLDLLLQPSAFKNNAPNGGNIRFNDAARPCHGTGVTATLPAFPCPLPPNTPASLL